MTQHSFLQVGGDKSDAAEQMNQSVAKASPRFIHDGQYPLLPAMTCKTVLGWYDFKGLWSGVIRAALSADQI